MEKASLEELWKLETRRCPGGGQRPNDDTLPVVSSHTAAQPFANHRNTWFCLNVNWVCCYGISNPFSCLNLKKYRYCVSLSYWGNVPRNTQKSYWIAHICLRPKVLILNHNMSSQTLADKMNLCLRFPDKPPLVGCLNNDCTLSEALLQCCKPS